MTPLLFSFPKFFLKFPFKCDYCVCDLVDMQLLKHKRWAPWYISTKYFIKKMAFIGILIYNWESSNKSVQRSKENKKYDSGVLS